MSKLLLCRLGVIAATIMLAATAGATDLYEVTLTSQEDAATLRRAAIDPLLRTHGGYLVLADEAGEARLARSGLHYSHVASDIDRNGVVMDLRKDDSNVGHYPLVYEEGGLRLYRFDVATFMSSSEPLELALLQTENIRIVFPTPPVLNYERLDIDLDSAIALIRQDSLESYSTQLENFGCRYAGTGTNYAVRNWLMDRFGDFGYDSVVSQEFPALVDGNWRDCHNVIAYKVGTLYPHHYIIIGAHRHAVWLSPGADDNGSGICGVLELARVLQDIETNMTVVFALFDKEEGGLWGAYHYANEAVQRGDSIVLMFNMDMIAHYENDTEARLNIVPSDSAYGLLCQALADSLSGISLTGHLRLDGGGSDNVPFSENGFNTIYLEEQIRSSVYHQPNDSTVYLNYDYLTRMIRSGLATSLVVDRTYQVDPWVYFTYPYGTPNLVYPDYTTSVLANILAYPGAEIIPGSGQLHYSIDGGEYATVALTPLDDVLYEATLPELPCNAKIDYYFSAEDYDLGVIYDPGPGEPFTTMASTGIDTLLIDHFDEDLGWTVSGDASYGFWERVDPDWPFNHNDGMPWRDFDGFGKAYLTDNSAFDVDGGATILTSPPLEVNGHDAKVRYARWYSNHVGDAPFTDSMLVEVYDGTSWHVAEVVGPVNESSGGWYEHEFWISEFITPPQTLLVRFVAADEGEDSNIEAAVDAVLITQQSCRPIIITEAVPEWTQDVPMTVQLNAAGGTGSFTWLDTFNELAGSGLSLATDGMLSGTPLNAGPITFTAMATDENNDSDERQFSFDINPQVVINTGNVPDGVQGIPYAVQLESSGGTGDLSWQDQLSDLDGTGLTLASDGMLSGQPIDTGVIQFTARVEDAVGGYDEQPFSLSIGPDYICGDIDHSGHAPDIADLVYLVDFMFNGGPVPQVMIAGDVDGSGGNLDIADLVYLVDFMFTGGPPPVCL